MNKRIGVIFGAVILTGCASTASRPSVAVYPAKGQSTQQQHVDSNECVAWAKQHSGYDPAFETAKGAGVGAVVGALGGAATGAAGGAATGGGYKYVKSCEGYDRAFAACMEGRGYSVK